MAWSKYTEAQKIKRNQFLLAFVLFIILLVVGFILWQTVYSRNRDSETTQIGTADSQAAPSQEQPNQEQTPLYNAVALQSLVNDWVNNLSGTASVVVMTPEEEILAAFNSDQVYFAASLYKLYVAYEGYEQIDAGSVDADEQYLNGNTRAECLDLMIRESNSPCAEKLWQELGKLELTNTLREYGITNTSMVNISTTAYDVAVILSRVARGEGLSQLAQSAYLDSMKTQDDLYRRGLPSGFSDKITVYNKVGWNELVEWHDAAIVELPDGERLIITVLTENVGTANIRELAQSLEVFLLQ